MKTQLVKIQKNKKFFVRSDTQFVLLMDKNFPKENVTLEFIFDKPTVEAEILFLYSLDKNAQLNVSTIINHKSKNTRCITKVRGVLGDGAISNYVGKIIILKKAQQTFSFLEDKVLVVGNDTKNNSQPILMIDANDVSASHSASTGRIDADQLYYLQSRGINKGEAEKIITDGFFTQLASTIKDEKVRSLVKLKYGKY